MLPGGGASTVCSLFLNLYIPYIALMSKGKIGQGLLAVVILGCVAYAVFSLDRTYASTADRRLSEIYVNL